MLYHPNWLNQNEANELFRELQSLDIWQHEKIRLFGKDILVPRLVFWMGDNNAHYRYSNTCHSPVPWNQLIFQLKERIHSELGLYFNSVLANFYRNGKDYMGWHRDNEPELGDNPSILSISLGAERRFCMKNIKSNTKHELKLAHGSALVMQGDCQEKYKHALPKTTRISDARINLTFRHVIVK